MTAAVFALIIVAEIDPNALLARVAERYVALRFFALEVRQNGQSGPTPGAMGTTNIRLEVGAGNRYFFREVRDSANSLQSRPPDESLFIAKPAARRRL